MPALPAILQSFADSASDRFGPDAAGCSDSSAYVAIDDTIVHVNLDPNAGRAVIWAEVARPARSEFAALEREALAFTGREFLAHGLVLGINRSADLILLGRSVEQDVLTVDEGLDLVRTVAQAVPRAEEALEAAVTVPAGRGLDASGTMFRI